MFRQQFRNEGRLLISVHLFPQMRNAAKIKTIISPTIDAVKSQVHTTEVFRFITQLNYVYQRTLALISTVGEWPTRVNAIAIYDKSQGACASLGISTSPICSSERSLKISSAFVNISSSLAALGSVAARAASRGRTFSDEDMVLSAPPSLGGKEPGDCFIMLTLENLKSMSVIDSITMSAPRPE